MPPNALSAPPCKNTLTLNKHTPRLPPPPSPPNPHHPPKIPPSASASLHTSINRCDDALHSIAGPSAVQPGFSCFGFGGSESKPAGPPPGRRWWVSFLFCFVFPLHLRPLTALAIILATCDTETKDLTGCQFPSCFFPFLPSILPPPLPASFLFLYCRVFLLLHFTSLSRFAPSGHRRSFKTSKQIFFLFSLSNKRVRFGGTSLP